LNVASVVSEYPDPAGIAAIFVCPKTSSLNSTTSGQHEYVAATGCLDYRFNQTALGFRLELDASIIIFRTENNIALAAFNDTIRYMFDSNVIIE
jgi:hypothetical protein